MIQKQAWLVLKTVFGRTIKKIFLARAVTEGEVGLQDIYEKSLVKLQSFTEYVMQTLVSC